MKLIVGLGNPGHKYQSTLHNLGFMLIDYLLQFCANYQTTQKHHSHIYHIDVEKNKALLLKPQTYMNLSGQVVQMIMQKYQISLCDVLVITDDIYLKENTFKLKMKGGHGGHNGLRNIIDCLRNQNFKRLRIGVGYDLSIPLDQYLLTAISDHKKTVICQQFPFIKEIIFSFIKNLEWDKLLNL